MQTYVTFALRLRIQHLGDLGVEEEIKMRLNGLKIYGLDSFGSQQHELMGSCEHVNEHLSSVEGGNRLDYRLHMKEAVF
jgi:hypothetical protein